MDKLKEWWQAMSSNKNELTFSSVGVLMLLVIVFYLINNISFLAGSFSQSFNVKVDQGHAGSTFRLDEAKSFLEKNKAGI